ncbi:MAG TPA: tyrosine--tRNA ligase [Bacillota bacterium]|nr:tyrosine--tRNA ligase [Bacillota bacterium]HNU94819.1 tyrosine--tRNA ligase [Bacillota bacterium]
MDPREQLEVIMRGAAEVISREDLLAKFEKSARTGRPLRVKLGLDPSAPDIHIGHTVVLHKMRQFQDMGHEAIIVIGDFTGRIGDPTGRREARKQLSEEEVRRNAATYCEQVFKIIDRARTRVVFNSEWLGKLMFADIIELASKVTVARMLERDDFETRYRECRPIGIHEFFYPLMQAYDSIALEADVELGGTDQKFNNLMGRTLQREFGQESQCVVLMPILPGLDGVHKMSKSLGNYIGISEDPSEIYGKTMSIPDELIVPYVNSTTTFALSEKVSIERDLASGALHPMKAKRKLARQLVAQYHGEHAAGLAEGEFDRVFSKGQLPSDMPQVCVAAHELADGMISVVALMVRSGLASSNSEARRLIDQGGVRLDDQRVADPAEEIVPRDGMVLRVGKRRFARVLVR